MSNNNNKNSSFSSFDYENFPVVKVTFTGKLIAKEDFDNFTEEWLSIFSKKKPFKLVFDTKNIGFINPKYCMSMAFFIHKLHNLEEKHLMEESQIIVFSNIFYKMLCITLHIQKPVAPVNIIYYENERIKKNYWVFP